MKNISKDLAPSTFQKEQHLFTAKDIFCLLTMIDELHGHKIRLRERIDGALHIHIGESIYRIWDEVECE